MGKRIRDLDERAKRNLGRAIQEARVRKGLTQSELSEQVGVTRTFLSLVETGQRLPSHQTLSRIAVLLGENVYSLLIEAHLEEYDHDFELVNILTTLIESRDDEKLGRLRDFVKSL